MTTGVLLGPQRHAITVTAELAALGRTGRIAAITAGWQEREAEDDELQDAIGHRAVNLRLHQRVDDVFAHDPELFAAHRARQDRLRQLQDLYRLRLARALDAAQDLFGRTAPAELIEPERDDAVAAIRTLDAHHLQRIRDIHAEFEATWKPGERDVLARHRQEVRAIVQDCAMIAIAGGHVATLLGRIRLLDVQSAFGDRPIVAWSAGAMVCCERVVLFHDRPPEGSGNAEILDEGLGLFPGVVALPHATRRLATDDLARMALFARRFAPAQCVCLDPRCRLGFAGGARVAGEGTRQIAQDGTLAAIPPIDAGALASARGAA
jgi:hypothetical protein